MAEFLYKAQNAQGNNFEGTLEAKPGADIRDARNLVFKRPRHFCSQFVNKKFTIKSSQNY